MYELTQEERMILSMVDDLCVDVVAPRAAEIDEEDEFPQDIYELFVEQGLFALAYGEEHGGVEVSMHCWVQVIERIARESPAVALMILISAIGSDALVFSGTDEQKRTILPALAAGEAKICFALTEPNAGSDISAIATTALPDGEGYTVNGSKIFITNGAVGDWFTVFARVVEDGQSKPSCFVVHRDTPGLVIGRKEDKMGLRGSVTSQLFFENMHVGPDAVVGAVGDGFAIAHHTLNRGRLAVAALAAGVTAASLGAAAAYAKERIQFGKHIADLQAIRFMLADMDIKVEAARQLMIYGITLETSGKPFSREAAMAKCLAGDVAFSVASDAIQIHGGYGYSREYPVEKLLRDAKIYQIFEGTNQIQRVVIAGQLLR